MLTGAFKGKGVLIPRILMRPQDEKRQPCAWQRLQSPHMVAYAMTISQSQSQSLDFAGIYLWTPVFTHGQLYVAASRTGNGKTTVFAIRSKEVMEPFTTKNVVYKEILTDYLIEG